MIRLIPAHELICILVAVFMLVPIIMLLIFPNILYFCIHELDDIPVTLTVNDVMVCNPIKSPVTFVVSDQMYLVGSNDPPVLRVVQL